ncbi:MAG: DUF4328 domain-containing protein [Bacteroidetes bacterium]|nr:DUF4328 domain-containing protein [Bacteroidota bacterium]
MSSRSIVPLRPYAVLITAGMSLLVLTKFIVVATDVWALRVFGKIDASPFYSPMSTSLDREVSRLDRWLRFADAADLLFFIYTAVVFIVFMHNAYRNIMQPVIANRRFSPGWTIGAFLIPVVNIVLPYSVMREIWQCSRALIRSHVDGHWREEERPLVLRLWWPTTLAAFFIMDFSEPLAPLFPRVGVVVISTWMHIVGVALYLIAVGVTLAMVWKLSAMQWRMLVNMRREETLRGR